MACHFVHVFPFEGSGITSINNWFTPPPLIVHATVPKLWPTFFVGPSTFFFWTLHLAESVSLSELVDSSMLRRAGNLDRARSGQSEIGAAIPFRTYRRRASRASRHGSPQEFPSFDPIDGPPVAKRRHQVPRRRFQPHYRSTIAFAAANWRRRPLSPGVQMDAASWLCTRPILFPMNICASSFLFPECFVFITRTSTNWLCFFAWLKFHVYQGSLIVNQHSNYRRVIYSPIKVVLRPLVKFKLGPNKTWIAREALLRAGEVPDVSLQRKPRRLTNLEANRQVLYCYKNGKTWGFEMITFT
jgi:hypothetical protein